MELSRVSVYPFSIQTFSLGEKKQTEDLVRTASFLCNTRFPHNSGKSPFRPSAQNPQVHTHTHVHLNVYIYITLHTLHTYIHYITLHYITLHYITYITYITYIHILHYITLHYITLNYITLHYITLHYITLHYIHTYISGNHGFCWCFS